MGKNCQMLYHELTWNIIEGDINNNLFHLFLLNKDWKKWNIPSVMERVKEYKIKLIQGFLFNRIVKGIERPRYLDIHEG